ncbi:MAG: nucleotidyltransferase domain-containing protein [Flavobacteriales bacterium]|nr:nucleotidyltransferase domain-containing protein [Flavobacteriales bacterium]
MDSARKLLNELNSWVNSPLRGESSKKFQDICEAHDALSIQQFGESIQITIPLYDGKNKNVLGLVHALQKEQGISSVILQGSLATDEEIPYSDFDALVIIEDAVFNNPKVLLSLVVRLQLLSRYIYQHDPLQHHGWFVTTEKLLNHHLDDFFPAVIFDHSRMLYPARASELKLNLVKDPSAFHYHLNNTVAGIEREITSGQYLNNMYELKSTLSKFMLLPALYMQVCKGEGVYKKDSFELAKVDFTAEEWNIMDEISTIREDWNQNMAGWRKWMITTHPSWSRKMAKRVAPKVAADLQASVKDKSTKMLTFARLMLERAKATNGQN